MSTKDPTTHSHTDGLAAPRPEDEGLPSIAEQVERVPTDPGCYLWRDASGTVIYVGKAKNLRARMRQYTTLTDDRAKIPLMMEVVRSFDYIVVGSEHEALVLERQLINQYHPYFNVDFKDDKSYPYIAITESDVFPAIKYTREHHKKGTRYFGPYTDAKAARATIDTLRKVAPICIATCAEWKRCRRYLAAHPDEVGIAPLALAKLGRPCFDYAVGRASAPARSTPRRTRATSTRSSASWRASAAMWWTTWPTRCGRRRLTLISNGQPASSAVWMRSRRPTPSRRSSSATTSRWTPSASPARRRSARPASSSCARGA